MVMARLQAIEGGRSKSARFETLIRRHYESLYRIAYRFTRSVHDAEDLVQEVCARAYPRLQEIEALEDPRGWLICVLRRLFIDQTRRYERKHVSSYDEEPMILVSDQPDPLELAVRADDEQRLERAWKYLEAEQRTLLALHDIEGYSLAELNKITGVKEGTLKSRLHRARIRLGRLLERDENVTALSLRRGAANEM